MRDEQLPATVRRIRRSRRFRVLAALGGGYLLLLVLGLLGIGGSARAVAAPGALAGLLVPLVAVVGVLAATSATVNAPHLRPWRMLTGDPMEPQCWSLEIRNIGNQPGEIVCTRWRAVEVNGGEETFASLQAVATCLHARFGDVHDHGVVCLVGAGKAYRLLTIPATEAGRLRELHVRVDYLTPTGARYRTETTATPAEDLHRAEAHARARAEAHALDTAAAANTDPAEETSP